MSITEHNQEHTLEIISQEGPEGYAASITFDNQSIQKAKALKFNLEDLTKPSLFSKLGKVLARKKLVTHHYKEFEIPVEMKQAQGSTPVRLLDKKIVDEILHKIKKDHHKYAYIHLSAVQIMFVSLFREGINCPILATITDGRFTELKNAYLGTIEGNLGYKKVLFTVYP